ncbi:MAG: hypothetical protein KDA22_04345 [Phycisphaerales bacterium]|nr:hypothetical protein [Phycisphaerales bacterium]
MSSSSTIGAAALLAIAFTPPTPAALVIGGFDATRGGGASIADGDLLDTFRDSITTAFPGTTFSGTGTLTAEYLETIDLLVLFSAKGGVSAITPLSLDEQSAVMDFVSQGGPAILFVDNDSFGGAGSDAANESVVDFVGLDATGTGSGWSQPATIADPEASALASGPFGTVANWTVGWSGWFDFVPRDGIVIGTIDQSGLPGLVVFPPDAIGPGSAAVVAYADSTGFVDGYLAVGSNNETLLLNSIAYLAPATRCIADLDDNGIVDGADLGLLLAAWNTAGPLEDLDGNGTVDGADLGVLLGAWGPCGA